MKTLTGLISLIVTVSILVMMFTMIPVYADSATYYVDSVNGSDSNNGTSDTDAWKSLDKVNSIIFQPGDRILFKRGGIWEGQLHPQGSGSAGHPVTIDAYGTGNLPVINGNNVENGAVYFLNQDYWTIRSLEVTNIGPVNAACRKGIYVKFNDGGTHHYIHILDCYVHHVNGMTDNREGTAELDWDGWNNSAGINVQIGADASERTYLDDLLIQGCESSYNDSKGIVISDLSWHLITDKVKWYPFTNVVIRNNILDHNAGDGIVVGSSDSPLVEYNVGSNNHFGCETNYSVAMWPIQCKNAVFQFNEAYATRSYLDGQGFDMDWDCFNSVMQYNYSHDNMGGFMLICNDGGSKRVNDFPIARYNISQNDGDANSCVFSFNGPVFGASVYNNTIYQGPGHTTKIVRDNDWGGHAKYTSFYNNIFYMEGTPVWNLGAMTDTTFDYNVFYGRNVETEPADPHKLTTDPMLVDPGSGETGLDTLDGYKLRAGSPAIGSGKVIENNGGLDFWGNPVSATLAPNRGAYNGKGEGFAKADADLYKAATPDVPITDDAFDPDATYRIINRNSGMALGIQGGLTTDAAYAVQSAWDINNAAEYWRIAEVGGGKHVLINKNSGRALSINNGSAYEGTAAVQLRWNNTAGQLWYLNAVGGGYYTLTNVKSNKALGIARSSKAAGSLAQQFSRDNSREDQQWLIEAFTPPAPPVREEEEDPTLNALNCTASAVSTDIDIDGDPDAAWDGKVTNELSRVSIQGTDDTAKFGVLWDYTNLYVMVDVKDSNLSGGAGNISDNDSVDLYIDADHAHHAWYQTGDFMYHFTYDGMQMSDRSGAVVDSIDWAAKTTADGYRVEVRIPWSTVGKTDFSAEKLNIGFDVMVNDAEGGLRIGQLAWNDGTAMAWSNPSLFGNLYLEGTPAGEVSLFDSNAYYTIVNRDSGKYLTVNGDSTADGSIIGQGAWNYALASQQWQIVKLATGNYRIVNRNSGKALGIDGASKENNASVVQNAFGGSSPEQQWEFTDAGSGYFLITNVNSGKAAMIGKTVADSMMQTESNDGWDQQWKIVRVGNAPVLPTFDEEKYYKIVCHNGSSSLKANEDGSLEMASNFDYKLDELYWTITDAGDGNLIFVNKKYGTSLAITSPEPDTAVGSVVTPGDGSELWRLIPSKDNGYYGIINAKTANALDSEGSLRARLYNNEWWTSQWSFAEIVPPVTGGVIFPVSNGDFESGRTDGWTLKANLVDGNQGAADTLALESASPISGGYSAKIHVINGAKMDWGIVLEHSPLPSMQSGKTYRISLKGKASADGCVYKVVLKNDGGSEVVNQAITLGTTAATTDPITFECYSDIAAPQLMLFLGWFDDTDIWLDDIQITEENTKSVYPIVNGSFEGDPTNDWNVVTAGGAIAQLVPATETENAYIDVTNGGTSDWHVVLTPIADLPAMESGYTYNITLKARTTADGSNYRVVLKNDSGSEVMTYDEGKFTLGTDMQTIVRKFVCNADIAKPQLLFFFGWYSQDVYIDEISVTKEKTSYPFGVKNGTFEGGNTDDWGLILNTAGGGTGAAALSAEPAGALSGSYSLKVNVTNGAGADWGVVLKQSVPPMQKGKTYHISLKGKAAGDDQNYQVVFKQGDAEIFKKPVKLNSTATDISFDYICEQDMPSPDLMFFLGWYTGDIYLDDIVITEKYTE